MQYSDEVCRVWAKMDVYRNKLHNTRMLIAEMLTFCKNPYIAFSCGKDSSVMADIILSIDPTVPCRFVSSGETRILHNVDDVMGYFKEKYQASIEEIVFDRVFTEEWKEASFDEQRKAGRRDIQSLDNSSFGGVFMGLRKQESRGRCVSLITHHTDGIPKYMYQYAEKEYYRMCPMADWKTEDIGAYLVTHEIPVLDWYKEYGYEARTTARLTGDAVRQNTIFYIKTHNPEGYQRLVQRFPELRIY